MSYFLLVDCNNFFVSCERVFRPDLRNRPVVVLSNNDGCVIARSNEAKEFGIQMGQPVFKCRDIIRRHRVVQFSSNFSLYGDMSRRVMAIIAATIGSAPSITMDVYSVDEAFVQFHGVPFSVVKSYAPLLHRRIQQYTGLPVSIGVASTKVLAKLAVTLVKKQHVEGDLFVAERAVEFLPYMKDVAASEVWGIGRRFARTLDSYGVKTVADFFEKDPQWLRKRMGVSGTRLLSELQGVACIERPSRLYPKSVLCSRSFRDAVTEKAALRKRVMRYASGAAARLRRSGARTMSVTIFMQTGRHASSQRVDLRASHRFDEATHYTPTILDAVGSLFDKLYEDGVAYKRAGVLFSDVVPPGMFQASLLVRPNSPQEKKVMRVLDTLNAKKRQIDFASALLIEKRDTRNRSARYTTQFSECLTIQA